MSRSKTIWTTIVGVMSSILAFLGLIGCCGLPILAGILAALGIGASQLSFFTEYRWWFIGLTIISLLFGFYQVYFKKKSSCCETEKTKNCCSSDSKKSGKPKSPLFQKIFLWTGTAVIAIILIIGFKENNTINLSNESCCPTEEIIQNSDNCCPETMAVDSEKEQSTDCCP